MKLESGTALYCLRNTSVIFTCLILPCTAKLDTFDTFCIYFVLSMEIHSYNTVIFIHYIYLVYVVLEVSFIL